MQIVEKCVGAGHDVWMNDADAVWLHDPWPVLQQHIRDWHPDILAQRGRYA